MSEWTGYWITRCDSINETPEPSEQSVVSAFFALLPFADLPSGVGDFTVKE